MVEVNRRWDLAELLRGARPVPLTGEVRLVRKDFEVCLAEERSWSDDSERARDAAEELQRLIENAKPIPLTDQVRFDGDEAWRLLTRLRGTDSA